MELFEVIERLKETHDKQDFDKAINMLNYLIEAEIGSYIVPYDIEFTSKEKIENQELKEFVSSDILFEDLIKGNIVDLDSFNKVVDLVILLKQLELRVPDKFCNFGASFEIELLESLKSKLKLDDAIFEKYAELLPYMLLDREIILFDGENSYNIIKSYFENFDRNDYYNIQYEMNFDMNENLFEILSDKNYRSNFKINEVLYYLENEEEYNENNRLLNEDGLLKQAFDEQIYELLDDRYFIEMLNRIKTRDYKYEDDKSFQRIYMFSQLRESISQKIFDIKMELFDDDCDEKKILGNINKLTNYFLMNSVFNNDSLILDINKIYEFLKSKRNRYL